MDEANIAIDMGILDVDEVVSVLKNKPEEMEIVLTGRKCTSKNYRNCTFSIKNRTCKTLLGYRYCSKRKGIEY